MAAQKQAKQNGDAFVGTDTLIKALTENKEISSALTEAGARTDLHAPRPLLLCCPNPAYCWLEQQPIYVATTGISHPYLKQRNASRTF